MGPVSHVAVVCGWVSGPGVVRLTPETKRNSRRRAWRRISPTSAECLSRSIILWRCGPGIVGLCGLVSTILSILTLICPWLRLKP